jgi:hypothetical protein
MSRTSRTLLVILVLLLAPSVTTLAKKSRLEGRRIPISQALEEPEPRESMMIEGRVVSNNGEGLFLLDDGTGQMHVYIPSHVLREPGSMRRKEPQMGERIRVSGIYSREPLNKKLHGIVVSELERDVEEPRREPSAQPPSPETPAADEQEPAPAAPSVTHSITPDASREWVEKLRAARAELLETRKELQEAEVAYGRELNRAGKPSLMDPAVVARQDHAEKRLAAARLAIGSMVLEARKNGVPEDVLALYQQATLEL